MKNSIAESNTFCTSVIPKQLDDRARLLAAQLRTTRSKLIGIALADYVARFEQVKKTEEKS